MEHPSRVPRETYGTVSYGYVSVRVWPMTSVMRSLFRPAPSSPRGTVMTATTDLAITPDESARPAAAKRQGPIPEYQPEPRSNTGRVLIAVFTGLPMVALVAAVPVAWIWGFLNWQTVVVGIAFYLLSGLGIAMGFHRYFTHTSFKANRALQDRPRRGRIDGPRGADPRTGYPTTAGTTSTATKRATRTRRGDSAPTSGRCSRASSGRTWDGCSTGRSPRTRSSRLTGWPTRTS